MEQQAHHNYERIAQAIHYIQEHFRAQPDLDTIARSVHLSPAHFQRLFTEWAGISPKKFVQYISISHAKKLLAHQDARLFDTAMETGLSGTSRLHDLFVHIEGMSPAEYRDGGRNLNINYQFGYSPFGMLLVASTAKGICHMAFVDQPEQALDRLKAAFPQASFLEQTDPLQQQALTVFQKDWTHLPEIRLHLKGTAFQLKVWETLLRIPMGAVNTYGHIAAHIGKPRAARAVGTAIGSNPVAFLIPCHRVIQASGHLGGYMWGTTRKTAMIGWECARGASDSL